MSRLLAIAVALLVSLPAWAAEARAQIHVSVRVVHPVKVQVEVPKAALVQPPRAVPGGTEWRVPLNASASSRNGDHPAGATLQVSGCEGATAEWTGAKGDAQREVRVFVPAGSSCEPVVVATVEADAAS